MQLFRRRIRPSVAKGAATGAVAGVVGAAAMVGFAFAWQKLFPVSRRTRLMPSPEQDVDSLVRGLHALFGNMTQMRLRRLAILGHFIFGAGLGAAYGTLSELSRSYRYANALALAASEEVIGNELVGWRMGITQPPRQYSGTERMHSFASHLLWAVVTESVRRPLRKAA